MKITVLLPAYNEEQTIAKTLADFGSYLPDAEFLVINNASSDLTAAKASQTIKELKLNGRVIHESRKGKAIAVRTGFFHSTGDIIILSDADSSYSAADVFAMLNPVLAGDADMVVGNRHHLNLYQKQNKRPFHFFGNRVVRLLVNRFFKSHLQDIMSGYRVFSRRFLRLYPNLYRGFELETDLTLFALDKRFRLIEVPIHYSDRPEGSFSKLSTFKDGMRVIFCIAQVLRYYRPLFFFSCMACLVSLFGLVVSIPVWMDWFAYHYIYHVPLAILASSLELVALIAAAIGLILDAIAHQTKIEFEVRLAESYQNPQK